MLTTPKIKALLNQISSGKLQSDRAKILNHIINRGESNAIHMKSLLNMDKQTLTARICGLEDLGVIYKSGTINDGSHSVYKYEPDTEKQKLNATKRELEKLEKWLKLGRTKFTHLMNEDTINFLNTL